MAAIQYLHLDMVAGGMQCCNERHQKEIQGVECVCGAMSCENIGTMSNNGRDNVNGYLVPIGQRCTQWTWKRCNHISHMFKHLLDMILNFVASKLR